MFPTDYHIKKRAYNIWKTTGRTDEKENWEQAKRELEWFKNLATIIGIYIDESDDEYNDDSDSENYRVEPYPYKDFTVTIK